MHVRALFGAAAATTELLHGGRKDNLKKEHSAQLQNKDLLHLYTFVCLIRCLLDGRKVDIPSSNGLPVCV